MQSPLRNVRKAHGFTLQHVAAGVQVNPATLSRIERLEQIPSIELAERLANFFKGEVSEMQILYPARFQSSQNQNGFKPQEDEKQVPTGAFFAGAIAVFDKTWKGPAISYIGRDELEACGEAFLAQVRQQAERLVREIVA